MQNVAEGPNPLQKFTDHRGSLQVAGQRPLLKMATAAEGHRESVKNTGSVQKPLQEVKKFIKAAEGWKSELSCRRSWMVEGQKMQDIMILFGIID